MIQWCVQHRSIVLLICSFIILTGIYIYPSMERQENPDVVDPMGTVECIYPGASPEDVEKLIIKPLEEHLGEISEIKKLKCYALDSVGLIKVTLKDLNDRQIIDTWQKVREKVDDTKPELPVEAWEPKIKTDYSESYGLLLGISSDQYSYKELKTVAKELKRQLEQDQGVKSVKIDGEVGEQIEIGLDLTKLEQYRIAPSNIIKLLQARNINVPGGNLELNRMKVPIQTSGQYRTVTEIKNTIVAVSNAGNPVYLKNVARIERKEVKPEVFIDVNNEKSLVVGVKYAAGQNVLQIRKRLAPMIENFRTATLRDGMKLTFITDQAHYVQDSIGLFEENLIAAIILVVLVILIAMGFRSSMIVSATIPMVVISVFVYMYFNGMQLHQISIAALIISLSLLVANGIVANDSIYLYLQKGFDRETACLKGVSEVQVAILSSTLTTIASFLPLAMMQGIAGKFVRSLPVLVSVALVSSYLFSLTMVPALAFKMAKPNNKNSQKSLAGWIEKIFCIEAIVRWYRGFIETCLLKGKLVLAITLVVFVLSLTLIPSLGMQLFPYVERDQYVVDIETREGSVPEETREVTKAITQILMRDSSVKSVMAKVGDGPLVFYTTFVANNIASNKAQLIVNGKQREIARLETLLNQQIPEARINFKRLENAVPVDFPVEIRVFGDSIPKLKQIAADIKNRIDTIPGIKNLQDTYGLDSCKLKVKVNEAKANLVGLTNYDIAATTRMAVNGYEISQLKQQSVEDDDIPIIIKIPEAEKEHKEIIDRLFFTSTLTGRNIPLGQIASVRNEFAANNIIRINKKRAISVGMFVADGFAANIIQTKVAKALSGYQLPQGYRLEYGGESEERNDAFTSMVLPAILAIIIIYLTMVFQFKNLTDALIIMGTIPLSFIGVIIGLKVTGYPIGFMALLGSISLMGVVVNNGIVLIDYFKVLEGEKEFKEALVEGCVTRMRPIVVGMITTVISLIPMLFSGGSLWSPMATAIIFGLIVSTGLTLVVIPVTYYQFYQRQKRNQSGLQIAGKGNLGS
jgi:multidrug efflux pump subunit AcrB